jgi:hypothetical protein
MLFSIINTLDIDLTQPLAMVSDGTYYAWVSRKYGDYNGSSGLQWYYSKYNGVPLGGSFALDPRIIPTHASLRNHFGSTTDPSDGQVTAGGSSLTSALADFVIWGVKRGDILVINSPSTLAGRYAIDGVEAGGKQLDFASDFAASSTAVSFHVERPTVPSFGYTSGSAPYVDGRVYVGVFVVSGGVVSSPLTKAYCQNGIYDTGWVAFPAGVAGLAKDHYLGVYPTQVDIFVKNALGNIFKEPTMRVDVQHVDVVGGSSWAIKTLDVPAFRVMATASEFTVSPTLVMGGTTIFYDSVTAAYVVSSNAAYSIRVILRR